MELNFVRSKIGVAESALTTEGIKITFVHRTKSLVIVYFGQKIIAECKNREDALKAVSNYMLETN